MWIGKRLRSLTGSQPKSNRYMEKALQTSILDFISVATDSLRKTPYANDRSLFQADIAIAAGWLADLHGGCIRPIVQAGVEPRFYRRGLAPVMRELKLNSHAKAAKQLPPLSLNSPYRGLQTFI